MTRKLLNPKKADSQCERRQSPFHAVEIRCTASSCGAAKRLAGRRYLSAEAPLLPLPRCDRAHQCACSYRHWQDRRGGPRRAMEAGLPPSRSVSTEKRSTTSRRSDDHDASTELDELLGDDTYYDFVATKHE